MSDQYFPKQYASIRFVGNVKAGEIAGFLNAIPHNATVEISVHNEVIVGVSRGSDVTTVRAEWNPRTIS